jgi:hypothetical protein
VRTAVAETSLATFRSLSPADYLQPKERELMAAFTGPEVRLTRQQLSERTGMALSGVCGRVRSLLDKQELTVRGERKDPNTGKPQELLGLPVFEQVELF